MRNFLLGLIVAAGALPALAQVGVPGPALGNGILLATSTVSSNVATGAGPGQTFVKVCNGSTTVVAYFAVGNSFIKASVPTTSASGGIPVGGSGAGSGPPCEIQYAGNGGYVAAITASGSTTLTVTPASGPAMLVGSIGGAGGGGAGGPTSIALTSPSGTLSVGGSPCTSGACALTADVASTVTGTTVVTCGGVNDTAAINTALAGGGHVVLSGSCLMGPSAGSLVVRSNTWLDAGKATINFTPTDGIDSLLTNTQVAQNISRTCTDVVMTVNSTAITSATCNFTQADVENDSIACIGAYAGGLAYGSGAMGTDLHTTISNVTSTTAAQLADPPTAVSNPMTCNIYTRDSNITISGGTWILKGAYPAGNVIKMMTVNNLTMRDVHTASSSLTVPSTGSVASGFENYILDVSNFRILNTTLGGWVQGEDGIHLVGPLRSGEIIGVHGHSGDDMVPISAADGNPVSGMNSQLDGRVYGVVDGLLIDDVDGSSYAAQSGVKMFGPTGTAIPIRNINIRHVYGNSQSCKGCGVSGQYPGFRIGVALYSGSLDNIVVDGVGGNITGSDVYAIFGAASPANALTIGSLTLKDLSQTLSAYATGIYLFATQYATINNLTVDGIRSSGYNLKTSFFLDPTSSINNLIEENVQFENLTGGAFSPFLLQGTIGDATFTNIQANYNSATASAVGFIDIGGATVGKISLNGVHLEHASGSATALALLEMNNSPTGVTPVVGDIEANDISDTALAATSDLIFFFASGTLANYSISNLRASHITDCVDSVITPSGSAYTFGFNADNIANPSTCNAFSPGTPALVGSTVALTNQAASIAATTIYTSTSASQMLQAKCTLTPGSTTGTATVGVYILWNNSANFAESSLFTTTANTAVNFAPIFIQTTSGQTVKYQTAYTAGTGGSYNLTCALERLQ
ncbi:MAG TPA: hypothetical protein VNX47_05880 [Nevskia sp.]|jgi:hypothetical protein|nr:hypothetical protein [Nevskia sp.]